MLKRIVILLVFFGMLFFVGVQTHRLSLSFFVLLPLILLPVFYLLDSPQKNNLILTSACFSVFTFVHALLLRSVEVFVFALIMGIATAIFYFYRRSWFELVHSDEAMRDDVVMERDQLKVKFESRMDSLHHLENQVGSLIDLYEIARDFNECLNLEAISSILQKNVLPELHFKRMILVVRRNAQKAGWKTKVQLISKAEVDQYEFSDDDPDKRTDYMLEQQMVSDAQGMVKDQKKWIFPLLKDDKLSSFAIVEHAQEDDLAKCEVLMAYLSLQIKKVELYQEVKELSIRDGLTDVFVRRHFMERFEEELRRSEKFGLPIGILMLDIDLFKRYNDEHGHLAGDAALRTVASLLTDNLRKLDVVGRYGGEEFVIILPESSREGARDVAERIRSSVARYHFMLYKERTRVTVSIGGVFFPNDLKRTSSQGSERVSHQLIEMADKALYRAKEEGRNQVVFNDEL